MTVTFAFGFAAEAEAGAEHRQRQERTDRDAEACASSDPILPQEDARVNSCSMTPKSSSRTSVAPAETSSEPMQPRRFEKKTNIACHTRLPMSGLPKLSVLDLATVADGSTPADALRNSLELAQHVERLGFHRYWVAEHHNMPGIASSAPAVLIAEIASATETMRVGSGGVMLPNHAPLVVAEQFGMLDALHPGRIDLGIGRAPGTDGMTAMALRRDANPLSDDDFPQTLGELVGFFEGKFPEGHPYGSITAVPGAGNTPEIWLLGSSGYSAQVAGMLGWPFSLRPPLHGPEHAAGARALPLDVPPSDRLEKPEAMVAVAVICADDDETARYLSRPARLSMARLRSGRAVADAVERGGRGVRVLGRGRGEDRRPLGLGDRRRPGHGAPPPGGARRVRPRPTS